MSWNMFKVNMLLYMNNPIGVVSPAQYAIKLATEYDSSILHWNVHQLTTMKVS